MSNREFATIHPAIYMAQTKTENEEIRQKCAVDRPSKFGKTLFEAEEETEAGAEGKLED